MTIRAIGRQLVMPKLVAPVKASQDVKAAFGTIIQAHAALLEQHNKQNDLLTQMLRGGLSAANNSSIVFKSLVVTMPDEAPWRTLTPINGWGIAGGGTFDAPGYLMEPGGRASARGLVKNGSTTTVAAQMPAGYGPAVQNAYQAGTNVLAELKINNAGQFIPVFSSGSPQVSLCFSWLASPAAAPHAFVGGNWPVVIDHGLPQCTGCEVLSCLEATTGARGAAGAPVPDWEDIGAGQLRLNALWGLQWGKRYNIVVRMSQEA